MNSIKKLLIRTAGVCMILLAAVLLFLPDMAVAQVPNCAPISSCLNVTWRSTSRYVHLSNFCWVLVHYRMRYCPSDPVPCQIIIDYVQKLDYPEICLYCDPLQNGMTMNQMLVEIHADIINRSRGIIPCNNSITRVSAIQPLCWQHGLLWYDNLGNPCFGGVGPGSGCTGVYQKYTYYPCSTQACCEKIYDVQYFSGTGIVIIKLLSTTVTPANAVCTWPCEPVCP